MSISYSFSNKNSVFLKIIFMLVPSLLCKIIFPFCLIASMIKTCFCKYYRRLGQRFLCLLSYPPSCSWKKVGGFRRPPPLKTGVKPRHHREHFLQHIAIYPLVRFNVLRPALECLFAERPAVEAHIVEVCPCIIDDVKAVGTRLVPRKAHA